MAHEIFGDLPWPYPDDQFPENLAAVVQHTVADGSMPALVVAHDAEGFWLVGDGVNDAGRPDACALMCIWSAIRHNSSMAGLADVPLGWAAERDAPGEIWRLVPFAYRC